MEYNCAFTRDNKWFRYRAAAIIIEDNCVLFANNELCRWCCTRWRNSRTSSCA